MSSKHATIIIEAYSKTVAKLSQSSLVLYPVSLLPFESADIAEALHVTRQQTTNPFRLIELARLSDYLKTFVSDTSAWRLKQKLSVSQRNY